MSSADHSPDEFTQVCHTVVRAVEEGGVYLRQYLRSSVDLMEISVRDAYTAAMWRLLRFLLLYAVLVLACGMLCYGAALGISDWLGRDPWVGFVVVGATVLIGQFLRLSWIGYHANRRAVRRRRAQSEREHAQRRARFGHDAGAMP